MLRDNRIWIGNNEAGEPVYITPKMANRHGLVAGATGTGKTVTLKVLAETFSEMGIPVFMADVKGDIAGMMKPGEESEDMKERIARFGLEQQGFQYEGFPVNFWDVYGEKGIQLRTTISEMGPLLLSRILDLNELQGDILTVVFKIADDNGMILDDIKDLKALLAYVDENRAQFQAEYGKISSASIGVIIRALVALESSGGDRFFGEPALSLADWLAQDNGKGVINILDSTELIHSGRLYSTFLLWMISELFEMMPEVGDLDKPKMVFFFDEAHLLFSEAPKALLEKIEQVVKLIRSKGVGIYFCTQNPKDIPDGVLAQLNNKIQHGLRAYTPAEQKDVAAAADAFRENPAFKTFDTILNLGTGEAVVSFLDEEGIPAMAEKVSVLPPRCSFGTIGDEERRQRIQGSLLYSKYATAIDDDSAYELLQRKGIETQQAQEAEKEEAEAAKAAEKEAKEAAKAKEKEEREAAKAAEREEKAKMREVKKVGSTVLGTVGREVGKNFGKKFGSFGKTLGGNFGAQLGRGLLNTLIKK